jgi:hypothetical protein
MTPITYDSLHCLLSTCGFVVFVFFFFPHFFVFVFVFFPFLSFYFLFFLSYFILFSLSFHLSVMPLVLTRSGAMLHQKVKSIWANQSCISVKVTPLWCVRLGASIRSSPAMPRPGSRVSTPASHVPISD